jgi:hypothetical protein
METGVGGDAGGHNFAYHFDARLPFIETYYALLGPHIDIAYCVGDDLADQRGACIGIDTYRKLFKPLHTRIIAAVRRHTAARKIETLGRGGGYVFAPCHNIQAGNPAANIVAMYEAAWPLCS